MLNNPSQQSGARAPRGIVRVTYLQNGQQVTQAMPGWVDWEVNNNDFRAADTFRVSFSLTRLPAQFNGAWWAAQQQLWVEILAGFPADPENYDASQFTSWIYGKVDELNTDPVSRMIELHGRDLTADMIDTKTTQKWQNKTSSEIAALIAAAHGLGTTDQSGNSTVTKTTTKVGKFYQIEHAKLLRQQTEWDLLCWLAQEEGFVVFVRGKNLYFQPKPDPVSAPQYVLQWVAPDQPGGVPVGNVKHLAFSRNLTLARDVVVTVKSWNMKNKKGFTKTARAVHVAGSPGTPQTYSYTIPNLTPEKALKRAQALLAEITAHEVRLSASLPGDNLLDVTCVLPVTGTDYDQTYYPDSITREMSAEEGYTMRVSAKNSNPNSMVTL